MVFGWLFGTSSAEKEPMASVIQVGQQTVMYPSHTSVAQVISDKQQTQSYLGAHLLRAGEDIQMKQYDSLEGGRVYVFKGTVSLLPNQLANQLLTAGHGIPHMAKNRCKVMATIDNQSLGIFDSNYFNYDARWRTAFLKQMNVKYGFDSNLGLHYNPDAKGYKLVFYRIRELQRFLECARENGVPDRFCDKSYMLNRATTYNNGDEDEVYWLMLAFGDEPSCGNWYGPGYYTEPASDIQHKLLSAYKLGIS